MGQQWITANQAAEWLGCSVGIIYRWIHETHDGTASVPLLLKPRPGIYGRGKSWLIESQSLLVADGSSAGRRLYVKKDQGSSRGVLTTTSRHVEEDTRAKVQADRKRWVEGWVAEGKPLDKVLTVFPPSLHSEIEVYYCQAVEKRKSVSSLNIGKGFHDHNR